MKTDAPNIAQQDDRGALSLPSVGLLLMAQLSVAGAPVLIALCDLPPASVAALRLFGASLLFLPFALPRLKSEIAHNGFAAVLRTCFAGVLFGVHFVLFIMAFKWTSFESVVVLLSFQPVSALILGRIMLGERSSKGMWVAVGLAICGLITLVGQDALADSSLLGGRRVLGDAFVIGACVLIVLSYIAGRTLRQRFSFPVYIVLFFGSGAVAAGLCALVLGEDVTGASGEAWLWLLALILLPTALGHALFHYLVKHVRVFYINIVFVLEPLFALTAKWLIDMPERFGPSELTTWQIVGAGLLLAGVSIGLVARERIQKTKLKET